MQLLDLLYDPITTLRNPTTMLYYVMSGPVVFAYRGHDLNRLGGVQMASLRRNLIYLLLAFILVLALSACVRPFGQSEAEQAEQATQEAEAQAADQAEEEPQAEEETSEAVEEAVEPEGEAEETAPEETEAEAAEEVEESEEAVSSDPDVGGGTPDTEEEAPAAEEAEEEPSPEEEPAEEEVAEGEAEMSEETAEEAAAEEAAAEEAAAEEEPAEEAAAEEEMAEEAEAEEPMATTLPATHTVAPGENLFRIGLRYGISWIPLALYNDISNPNLIYTGQVLRIPGGQAPPTESAPEGATYTEYVVKRGDTVYKISRAFGVSPQEIVEANGLVNPNLIYAGQVLRIPTG